MIIPGFTAYDITEQGVVTKISTGEVIEHRCGLYRYVYLIPDKGNGKTVNVHRLLAEAFIPRPSTKHVAHLKDHDPTNVCLENIEWRLPSEISKMSTPAKRRPRPNNSDTPESRQMLLETLQLFREPKHMTELSYMLQVPYSVIRYSMGHLIADGLVEKTGEGYVCLRG